MNRVQPDLSSRGLPTRPDQNPLADRRQQLMQRQMMQAAALRTPPQPVRPR